MKASKAETAPPVPPIPGAYISPNAEPATEGHARLGDPKSADDGNLSSGSSTGRATRGGLRVDNIKGHAKQRPTAGTPRSLTNPNGRPYSYQSTGSEDDERRMGGYPLLPTSPQGFNANYMTYRDGNYSDATLTRRSEDDGESSGFRVKDDAQFLIRGPKNHKIHMSDEDDVEDSLSIVSDDEKTIKQPNMGHEKYPTRSRWSTYTKMPSITGRPQAWAPGKKRGILRSICCVGSIILVFLLIMVIICTAIFYAAAFRPLQPIITVVGREGAVGLDRNGFNITRNMNITLQNPNFIPVPINNLESFAVYNNSFFFGYGHINQSLTATKGQNVSFVQPVKFSYLSQFDTNGDMLKSLALKCSKSDNFAIDFDLMTRTKVKVMGFYNLNVDGDGHPSWMDCGARMKDAVQDMLILRNITLV